MGSACFAAPTPVKFKNQFDPPLALVFYIKMPLGGRINIESPTLSGLANFCEPGRTDRLSWQKSLVVKSAESKASSSQ